VIFYAPGQQDYGQRLARYLTSPVELQEDPSLEPGHVRLVAGLDFTTVHEDPTPVEDLPAPATTAPPAQAGGTPATTAATTPTTAAAPTTTTTEPNGFLVGEPPPGQDC
jgi:hypothetical protein